MEPTYISFFQMVYNPKMGKFQLISNGQAIMSLNDVKVWGSMLRNITEIVALATEGTHLVDGTPVGSKEMIRKQIQQAYNDEMNQTGLILPGGGK